jgi:hypothetical protein
VSDLQVKLEALWNSHLESVRTLRVFVVEVRESLIELAAKSKDASKLLFPYYGQYSDIPLPLRNITITPGTGNLSMSAFLTHVIAVRPAAAYEQIEKFPGLLLEMALIYRVALFDALTTDVLTAVFASQPEQLASEERKLTYKDIIDLHKANRLYEHMAQMKLDGFSNDGIRKQVASIRKWFGIDLASNEDELDQLAGFIAIRNLLVHSNGIVDRKFLKQVQAASFEEGDRVVVTDGELEQADKLLAGASSALCVEIAKRFAPDANLEPL